MQKSTSIAKGIRRLALVPPPKDHQEKCTRCTVTIKPNKCNKRDVNQKERLERNECPQGATEEHKHIAQVDCREKTKVKQESSQKVASVAWTLRSVERTTMVGVTHAVVKFGFDFSHGAEFVPLVTTRRSVSRIVFRWNIQKMW